MIVYFTYIEQDIIEQQDVDTSILMPLIEEIDDELIAEPKRDVILFSPKENEDVEEVDSVFYGIKNSENIPIRYSETSVVKEIDDVIEQLYEPEFKNQQIDSWQSLLLIITVLLLGLAKAFSVNRFKQTYKSLFNYRVAQEVCSEEKVFFHRVNVLLTTNYILITALLIYQVRMLLNNVGATNDDWSFYPLTVLFLLVIYFGKLISSKILSFVFNTSQLVGDYIFNVSLFNGLTGVVLIPVLSVMYFTNLDFAFTLRYFALPLLLISFGLRLIRLVVIGNSKGVSYFYIFLYICSLEILPLVVMLKFFIFK